jgi:hypothetical protein
MFVENRCLPLSGRPGSGDLLRSDNLVALVRAASTVDERVEHPALALFFPHDASGRIQLFQKLDIDDRTELPAALGTRETHASRA